MDFEDTIAAIATPIGEGAIAIVRISGNQAIDIVDQIFISKSGKLIRDVKTHTINYGHLIDPKTKNIVEEVLVSVMRAPHTFTREDIIEINCHGGTYGINKILQLVLSQGVRIAGPGEFTKRAFINGRIDLAQAEAVAEIIKAKTEQAMQAAIGQLGGSISQKIVLLRNELLEIMAQIEVMIDYPEYEDVEAVTINGLQASCGTIKANLAEMIHHAKQGAILRAGLTIAIIGRPNVGKSSLLNMISGKNKAIVTSVAGTTRDVVEVDVVLGGLPINLLDTAGIRITDDIVEKEGIKRSKEVLNKADLIIILFSGNKPFSDYDQELLDIAENKKAIIVINKIDLPKKIALPTFYSNKYPIVEISAKQGTGLKELEKQVLAMFFNGEVALQNIKNDYLANVRQQHLLEKAYQMISDALEATHLLTPIDLIQIDLTAAWECLGEVIGENVHEKLLDELFSKFCLGK